MHITPEKETGENCYGLQEHTLLKANIGIAYTIDEIKIGDILSGNNKVTGIIKSKAGLVNRYKYKNAMFSSRQIVYDIEKKQWNKVYNLGELCSIGLNIPIFHIITTKGYFELENGIIIRDFKETSNSKVNKMIDEKALSI